MAKQNFVLSTPFSPQGQLLLFCLYLFAVAGGPGLHAMEKTVFSVPFKLKGGTTLETEFDGKGFPREAFVKLFATSPEGRSEIHNAAELAKFGQLGTPEEAKLFFEFIARRDVAFFFRDIPGVEIVPEGGATDYCTLASAKWGELGCAAPQFKESDGKFRYTRVMGVYFLPTTNEKPAIIFTEEELSPAGVYKFSAGRTLSLGNLHGVQLPIYR